MPPSFRLIAAGLALAFVASAKAGDGLLPPDAEKALIDEYMEGCAFPDRSLSAVEERVLRAFADAVSDFCERERAVVGGTATPTPSSKARREETRTPVTFGGGGTSVDEIEQVLFGGELEKFDILVLLEDGTAVFDPTTPIHDIDPVEHIERHPNVWREWRRRGDVLELRYPRGDTWAPFFDRTPSVLEPVRRGMTLDGRYRYAESDPYFPGSATFASYSFTPEGRFEASSSDILGASLPGGSATAAASCDRDGRSAVATASGTGGVGRSTGRGSSCGAANVGTYVIEGYAIEFRAENGTVHRRPFYVLGNGTLIIGERWFGKS